MRACWSSRRRTQLSLSATVACTETPPRANLRRAGPVKIDQSRPSEINCLARVLPVRCCVSISLHPHGDTVSHREDVSQAVDLPWLAWGPLFAEPARRKFAHGGVAAHATTADMERSVIRLLGQQASTATSLGAAPSHGLARQPLERDDCLEQSRMRDYFSSQANA